MKKLFVSQIGTFHTNHNEDNLLISEIGNHKTLIAVMDGCTMGEESYFASTLLKKVIRKFAKEFYYKEFISRELPANSELIYHVLKKTFLTISSIKNELDLQINELLSTLIIGILDISNRESEILIIGDGLVSINGTLTEFNQDNKPDYFGYHLDKEFHQWFIEQKQKIIAKDINDLSIATDGIFTFRKYNQKEYPEITEREIIDILLNHFYPFKNERTLLNALYNIEKEYGLKPTDDISIIRIIFDSNDN